MLAVACIWLLLDTYLLTAIKSLSATFLIITALTTIAAWGVGRALSLLKHHLREEDLVWVSNFHLRLLPFATLAATVLLCISLDVATAWLGAERVSFSAQRVMCVIQSKAPARVSVERASVTGHGCFAPVDQSAQEIRVELSQQDRQINIGQAVEITAVSGRSLVLGQGAYLFSAKIEKARQSGH